MADSEKLDLRGYAGALLCVLIWGGQAVAVKVSLEGIPPLTVVTLRFAMAVVALGLLAVAFRQTLRLDRCAFGLLALNGLMLATQITLFTFGTGRTSSVHSIILIHTFPFFTAMVAPFFLQGHRLTSRGVTGLILAFAGIPVLAIGQYGWESGSLAGDLLILLAAVVMGSKIVYMKVLLQSRPPIQISFWDSLFTTLLIGIAALLFDDHTRLQFSPAIVSALIYQGLIVSVAGFLLWLFLLERYSANHLNTFRLFTPVAGIPLGAIILHEVVTPMLLLSALLIVGGLLLVQSGKRPPVRPA